MDLGWWARSIINEKVAHAGLGKGPPAWNSSEGASLLGNDTSSVGDHSHVSGSVTSTMNMRSCSDRVDT